MAPLAMPAMAASSSSVSLQSACDGDTLRADTYPRAAGGGPDTHEGGPRVEEYCCSMLEMSIRLGLVLWG